MFRLYTLQLNIGYPCDNYMKKEKPLSEKGENRRLSGRIYFNKDVAEAVGKLKEELLTSNNRSKAYIEFQEVKAKIDKIMGTFKDNHSPQTKQTFQKGSGDVLREDLKRSDKYLKVKTEDTHDICECGHLKKEHKRKYNGKGEIIRTYCYICYCKEFKPSCKEKEVGK